jgi:hypothetical protein
MNTHIVVFWIAALEENTASIFRVKVDSILKMEAVDKHIVDYITQETTRRILLLVLLTKTCHSVTNEIKNIH